MTELKTFCGADCGQCGLKDECAGCAPTNGRPFGGACMVAECCIEKGCGCESCGEDCRLRERLAAEFNALGIDDMEEITTLYALRGSYINLQYTLPGGQQARFWDDNRIYLGNRVCKRDSGRCFGLTADENHLLVCEYGGRDCSLQAARMNRIL